MYRQRYCSADAGRGGVNATQFLITVRPDILRVRPGSFRNQYKGVKRFGVGVVDVDAPINICPAMCQGTLRRSLPELI